MICSLSGERLGCVDLTEYDGEKAMVSILIFARDNRGKGFGTKALAQSAHAEGGGTQATAQSAHAEGTNCIASGHSSHASGYGTQATITAQTVVGKNNKVKDDALFIVGNGKTSAEANRSNAFEVTTDGAIRLGAASYGTEDIGEGAYLPAGQLYFVYEE